MSVKKPTRKQCPSKKDLPEKKEKLQKEAGKHLLWRSDYQSPAGEEQWFGSEGREDEVPAMDRTCVLLGQVGNLTKGTCC